MGRPLSVRLDDEAFKALELIAGGRMTRSEAIRAALLEAARRRSGARDLDAEIQMVAGDERDRTEKAEINAYMETLAGPG